ncbi:ATP-binding protein [Brevibacillus borstelensis]|uniref:hybrid sensor histidine kinase/response regulator n=1 Tax=Brevibacillus borstelensis TaxID=45462 RepID=UPI00203CE998|nr:ATP-binding protein [Brevibacillus borstelensis]MCM3560203.1 ATP-binding protein [Brevibacillus borstelensis]MCM3591734.1 ATP-binding protein [Brevibacillus borstelensis]
MYLNFPPDQPRAVQGVLDLRDWDFASERPISLKGEWEFYPSQFLARHSGTDTGLQGQTETSKKIVQVPGHWKSYLTSEKNSSFGYGTYRLRVLVNPDRHQPYEIRIHRIVSASELYVNGRLMGQAGYPDVNAEQTKAISVPYSAVFTADSGEIDIVIHAANYYNGVSAGMVDPVKFGSQQAVNRAVEFSVGTQVVVILILSLHIIYALIFFFLGVRQKSLIYFALLMMSAIFTIVLDDDRLLLQWMPLEYEWHRKLVSISFLGASVFLFQYVRHLFPDFVVFRASRWYLVAACISLILNLSTSALYPAINLFKVLVVLFPFLIIPGLFFQKTLKDDPDVVFLCLGAISIMLNLLWGIIKGNSSMEMGYYPLDMIATVIALASYWFRRYFRASTQTALLAEKLKKTDKLKDDFLVNTSHELRNPLHGILSIAQSVLDSGSISDNNSRENMKLLISVGRRMSLMLNDLIDLNRLKEGRIQLQVANVQVQTVASGVLDMIRFLTEGKPVRLVNQIPGNLPGVMADEHRLIQILFNLLHNAVKYTPEGDIVVKAQAKAGKVFIMVSDTGVGMDKETQLRIFQPYEQGSAGMEGGGFGLGLSICKQLVELHGGTIEVSSTPGKGTTFTFSLPLTDPSRLPSGNVSVLASSDSVTRLETAVSVSELPAVAAKPKADVPATEGARILAVDDDPVNVNVLVNILSLDHYEIVTASSGKEALAILSENEWDLVITDVMMPQMSGYELTAAIRERFSISELPILLLTARNRPEDIEAGFHSGANDYVTKPVDAMELRSRVRALTELKNSVGERLRLEAAWLQAQIQPHFLFNTLNTIAALSDIDSARMTALLEELGKYLRASFDFNNSKKLVPIEHELAFVRSYLFIEKQRHDDRLDVVWEVDDNIKVQIPPLSIQPLVENAIRHGLMKRARGGKIHIRVTNCKEYVEISVVDDGVGMDDYTLKNVLEGTLEKPRGIGLINTNRRLKQIYGKGLHIESIPGQGTAITFSVKK